MADERSGKISEVIAAYQNPALFAASVGLGVLAAQRANDAEPASNVRYLSQFGDGRCDLTQAVQFELDGVQYIRPVDIGKPGAVCADTLLAYDFAKGKARTDRGADATLYDDAAIAFNRERVLLPELASTDFGALRASLGPAGAAVAGVLGRDPSGGESILQGLERLGAQKRAEDLGLPVYYYRDSSGNVQQLVLGSFDLEREQLGIQVCERGRQPGSQAVVDCFNYLLRIAQAQRANGTLPPIEQVRALHPRIGRYIGPPCVIRNGLISPRCTEGSHFCGVPVWRDFPNAVRRL